MPNNEAIFIIEDDPFEQEFLQLHLLNAGYAVTGAAESAAEAIEQIALQQPSLVIIDIMLKGDINGIEASKIIRERFDIPFIFLTGNTESKTFEDAKITDPLAYLVKPFQKHDLVTTIDIALYRHNMELELKKNKMHLEKAQMIANIGSWEWDIQTDKLLWSNQIGRVFGVPSEALPQQFKTFLDMVHPDDRSAVTTAIEQSLEKQQDLNVQHRLVLADNVVKMIHERATVECDSSGNTLRLVGTLQDITEHWEMQQKIEHLAYYDSLTNIPNRNLFFDRLEQTLAYEKRAGNHFALLMLDLDGFKLVNDTFGHQTGDKLLQAVVERMNHCLRESDTLARTGGDEFIILLQRLSETQDTVIIVDRLINAINKSFDIDGHDINVSLSIGIAYFPEHGDDGDTLIKKADDAMYQAKANGRNQHCFHVEADEL